MNQLTNITDFYHGTDLLKYHCKRKNITEGDRFLTLKPVNTISIESIYNQISNLMIKNPLRCVGVIEAERSVFEGNIQKYSDNFMPPSFFHCHIAAKNCPEILQFKNNWINLNVGLIQSFYIKEINNQSLYASAPISKFPSIFVHDNEEPRFKKDKKGKIIETSKKIK